MIKSRVDVQILSIKEVKVNVNGNLKLSDDRVKKGKASLKTSQAKLCVSGSVTTMCVLLLYTSAQNIMDNGGGERKKENIFLQSYIKMLYFFSATSTLYKILKISFLTQTKQFPSSQVLRKAILYMKTSKRKKMTYFRNKKKY